MLKLIIMTIFFSVMASINSANATELFIETNPHLFLMNGYGAALGVEYSHLQIGVYGASTTLPNTYRDSFFSNAKNTKIKNSLAEIGFNFYLNPNNQGFYAGILYGPEWFKIQSNLTSTTQNLKADFLASKMGYRYFMSKSFYFDGGLGFGTKTHGDSSTQIDGSNVVLKSSAILTFFSIGFKI